MQRPTSRSWDKRLNLIGVVEIARTRQVAVSHCTAQPVGLPRAQEIVDAVVGSASTTTVREQHTLALWAVELSHICSQAHGELSIDARLRVARIIRIIDIWIDIYVDCGNVQVMRGETLGSLIDRIAEVGAELCSVKNLRAIDETSTPRLERKLDRLAKQYTALADLLIAER